VRDGVRVACDIRELTCVMGFYFLRTSNDIYERGRRFHILVKPKPGRDDVQLKRGLFDKFVQRLVRFRPRVHWR